jgi:CheY-like chemotaxis protein
MSFVILVVSETLKPLVWRARGKGLYLTLDIDAAAPDLVSGDVVRFRQVLLNLAGNAVKFTETGGIAVRLSVDGETAGGVILRTTVDDTGIGIPPEQLATIFEPFSQADASTTRRFGGTGLGLTIASRLVAMMDGRIWVESAAGGGSRFHFTVRLDLAVADGAPASVAPARDGAAPAPLCVLLAEDNPVNQRLAVRLLEKRGHTVTVAATGVQAVEAFARQPFDLVLMDVQMPELDGFEATAAIRRCEEGRGPVRTPIIAMTAHAMMGDRERCLRAGMDDYVSKPIRPNDLFAAMNRVRRDAMVA